MLMFAFTSFAQEGKKATPETRATANLQKMKKELSLTKEQEDKIYPILVEHAKKVDAIKADGKEKGEQQALRADTDKQITAVLTAEQNAKYQDHKKEMKEANKQKRVQEREKATQK